MFLYIDIKISSLVYYLFQYITYFYSRNIILIIASKKFMIVSYK